MAIAELTSIVKPPKKPLQVGTMDQWTAICTKLGVVFPDDYRDFCMTYGSGTFFDEIYIANPFAPAYVAGFESQQKRIQNIHEGLEMPYSAFPKLPGAIKLGGDGLGNELCYLAPAKEKNWAILTIQHEEEAEPEVHKMSLTTFLARIFGRKLDCNIWNEDNYFSEERTVTFSPSKF